MFHPPHSPSNEAETRGALARSPPATTTTFYINWQNAADNRLDIICPVEFESSTDDEPCDHVPEYTTAQGASSAVVAVAVARLAPGLLSAVLPQTWYQWCTAIVCRMTTTSFFRNLLP
jgi:hypothetical protein